VTDGRVMLADVHALAASLRELRALLGDLAEHSRGEDGCEGFRVLDTEEPAELVVLSRWRDEPALRAHFQTPHYMRYRAAVGVLLARPSDVTVFHISEIVHALDPDPPDPDRFD
jgi:quinol monooxygenase YgiN